MCDRPKRERKPTQPFQYHDVSTEQIIANYGSTPTKRSPKKSRTGGTPDGNASKGRGGARRRGRGRGPANARGKERDLNKIGNSPKSGRQSPELSSDEVADDEVSLSETVDNHSAQVNDVGNLDGEKEATPMTEKRPTNSQRVYTVRRRKYLIKGPVVSRRRGEEDEVIEQWYADPYERINPNDIAYDQWRLKNLHTLLENQGYSRLNSRQMAAWLMKCNGYFKEYTTPARRSRAKKFTQSVNRKAGASQDRSMTPGVDVHERDDEDDRDEEDFVASTQDPQSSQQEPDAAFATFQASLLPRQNDLDLMTHQSRKEKYEHISNTKSTESSQTSFGMSGLRIGDQIRPKGERRAQSEAQEETEGHLEALQERYQELNDMLKLENLQRCLNIFHAVYGSEGPQHNPGKFEHNHFSQNSTLPALVPKAGLRTQAHYALQTVSLPADDPAFFNDAQRGCSKKEEKACLNGQDESLRDVFTEDPDFGLTRIRPSERATEADMKLYYAQYDRAKTAVLSRSDLANNTEVEPDDEPHCDQSLRKPIVDPTLVKIQNEESAKFVSEQLEQKFFDWETSSTMLGGLAKQHKDDLMREGQFALKERHVWKELRQRQRILEEGGEEAAMLLEQEWEDTQLELKRERRRLENWRAQAKRRAARCDGTEVGMRKRVKFSKDIAEEW